VSNNTLRLVLAAASGAAISIAMAGQASAAAFYLQEQSVKGLGRAYSGESADVGAESLWWNPAAIAEIQGGEVYGGLNGVFSNSSVSDAGSTIQRPLQPATSVGGASTARDPLKAGVVPNFDAAWRMNEHWAIGLAVSAPFDFVTKYDASSFARYDALTSKLVDLDLQPTLAMHVNRYLDLGVGFDAQYAKSTLSAALPNLSPLLADGYNSLQGDGWNYGWTAGAQIHPDDRLSIGLSYRSRIDHKLTGTVAVEGLQGPLAGENGVAPASATFTTPWVAVLGARYRLDDHWTLDGQLQRVGWSEFRAITVNAATGLTVIPEAYHDTTTGAVGVDYIVNPKWTLRGGIAYDPTPTPDSGRSARIPDGNRWLFTVGTTVSPTPRLEFDEALGYVSLQRDHLSSNATAYAGTPVVTPIAYSAQISGEAFIVSSGLKFKF
jgi:long-chain fatty acid transport protein